MKTSAELQQQSLFRKLSYFGLILVLFTAMTFSGRVVHSATGGRWSGWTVSEQAERMQLRETSQGQANVLGSTVQVSLTGSRGFAVCALWISAIEKQKKHEWNDLKLLVNVITKLQPHFLTPWLFQSWNLAYNVSVESDRVRDKYFYISEGISLLAEGERINRGRWVDPSGQPDVEVGNPDMRFWIGFYYMNKFGTSDEQNALRSLFQMSCIDPAKRDPAVLRPDGHTVDLAKFREFVAQNPYLCRRLRDYLRCARPDDVVDYLEDNRKLPSRYEEVDGRWQLKQRSHEQFPVLPDYTETLDRAPTGGDVGGDFENYHVAWAWHEFAQQPLPPFEYGKPAAGVPEYDSLRYRMARSPMSILFRQYPPRCQSYIAERLQKEGWFDDQGWTVDEGHVTDRWFPDERVVVGNDRRYSSQAAWDRAYRMWKSHGEKHGMSLEQNRLDTLDMHAGLYRRKYRVDRSSLGPDLVKEQVDKETWDSFDSHRQLIYYFQNLTVTNFRHFLNSSEAESNPRLVEVRRLLYLAERQRKSGNPEQSMRAFHDAFAVLCGDPQSGQRGLLEEYPNFRRDNGVQEELFDQHISYLRLIEDHRGLGLRSAAAAVNLVPAAAPNGCALPAGLQAGLWYAYYPKPREMPIMVSAPLDGKDSNDRPWISSFSTVAAKVRLGLIRYPSIPVMSDDMMMPGMPPGMRPPPPPRAP